jgi:hypothetical protein
MVGNKLDRMANSIIALILIIGAGLTVGCSDQPKAKNAPFVAGKALQNLEITQIQTLSVFKDDAVSGDTWMARLERRGGEWRLISGPQGEVLTDDRADGRWVEHFLDTLRTLQAEGKAPESTLASYGLHRPVFRVEWTSSTGRQFFRLGSVDGPAGTIFAQFEESEKAPVILVRGAAIRMLTQLDTFDAIRERRLLTFALDDVDELLIEWKGGRRYLQRQGDFWADSQNRRYRGAALDHILATLEAVDHLRIETFPDLATHPGGRPALANADRLVSGQASSSRFVSTPMLNIRFKLRNGEEQTEHFHQHGARLFAEVSTRPGNRFGLASAALKWINKLQSFPGAAASR